MQILGFAVFLVVSHFGVMQIFRLTTYHALFWKALPLLIIYGAGVAWALFALDMHAFFLWQLILVEVLGLAGLFVLLAVNRSAPSRLCERRFPQVANNRA